MKIEKLETYLVSIGSLRDSDYYMLSDIGKYFRLNAFSWYYLGTKENITDPVHEYKAKDLEKEFQYTINVIHEQLPLL